MAQGGIQGAESPNGKTQESLLVVTEETSLGKGRTWRPIREGTSFQPLSMHSLYLLSLPPPIPDLARTVPLLGCPQGPARKCHSLFLGLRVKRRALVFENDDVVLWQEGVA